MPLNMKETHWCFHTDTSWGPAEGLLLLERAGGFPDVLIAEAAAARPACPALGPREAPSPGRSQGPATDGLGEARAQWQEAQRWEVPECLRWEEGGKDRGRTPRLKQ